MSQEQLISIIVPFYNEERFLERAIFSAIDQTHANTEIILVNDGSTDNSGKIAESYCEKYSNITLITTSNLGLGNARNVGLGNASGEFLLFLDSDDTLDGNATKIMVDTMNKDQSDIVVCKFTLYDKQQRSFKDAGWKLNNVKINGSDAVKEMYSGGISSVVWAKLYRAEVIQNILFPVGLWFEDRPFLMECFLNTDKTSFLDKSLFKIYSREDSITRRIMSEKRIKDLYLIYELEIQVLSKYNSAKGLFYCIINHHIDVLLDTFFLLIIDGERMESPMDKRKLFINHVNKFNKHYIDYPFRINPKRKIIIFLLNKLKVLPWSWIVFFVKRIFKKWYSGVKLLKNS